MTEAHLEAWMAGRLSPAEDRVVSRWLVRCTDPRLPQLLHGMVQARKDAERDLSWRSLGALFSAAVDRWSSMLQVGLAQIVPPEPVSVLASVDEGDAWQVRTREDGWMRIPGAPGLPGWVTVYSLDATHGARRLLDPSARDLPLEVQVALTPGVRTLVWVVATPSSPVLSGVDNDDLMAILDNSSADVRAVRWDP